MQHMHGQRVQIYILNGVFNNVVACTINTLFEGASLSQENSNHIFVERIKPMIASYRV